MENVFIEWIWKERVFLVRDNIWKMPTDMVSFAVSTGLGISVVAGILSGVCYVLAHGSPKKKSNRKSKSNLYCDVCGEYFRSIDHILGGGKAVSCFKCQKKVCQKRCANLDKEQDGWICKNCLRPPESWFQGILYAIQPNKKETVIEKMEPSENKGPSEIQRSREEVQDFIEKLVNSMLGQNIDDANVTKMYNDEHYLPLTGQQSPCTAHAALKQLIEKLLQDVLNLPQFQRPEPGAALPPDLNNKTYEDLLATAILNKVISNSQNAHPSSSAASVSSRISNSSHIKEEKEYFFGEQTLGTKWRHPDMETTSVSSLEDWLQSDSSFGSKKYVDRVTLTIKQDIEEVSLASDSDNEDEEDDTEYFRTKTSLWDDDEPNWFLQKRTFQGAHSPVPVPMLVPNPTTEAKVLIGDKEIDETSDLSDAGSDFGDAEIVPTRHSLLINSKTVIGGKNILQNGAREGESESESSADSGVKEVDRGQSVYDDSEFTDRAEGGSQGGFEQPLSFVSRADITLDDDNVEDASVMSVYSNTEQEAEYTEKYASLPRTIEKQPEPPPRYSFQKSKSETTTNQTQSNDSNEDRENEDIKLVQMHFSGTYSRREKEKWKNAVEMKNNPYSKENIEKRIKRSNSGVGSLFGPDYYAKLASSPSGTKAKSLEAKGLIWPPPLQNNEDIITNVNGVSTPEEKHEEAIPEKHISKTYISKEDNQDSFKAIPVIIQPEGDSLTLEFNQNPPKSPQTSSEMASLTSDSDLSYVHVYNVENAEVSKKPKEPPLETSTPDRFKFVKAPNTSSKRFVNTLPLKRHKSETDLLDESFYTPPKVLGKKKDNTLISKIYLDPQVRSFALSNRQQLPVNHVIPTFRTQLSNPEIVLDYKAYHSDDGVLLRNNKNHTVYSSEEDLLSSNSSKNDTMVLTAKMSLSSEDDQYSEKNTSYSSGPKKQLYSSSEDLLSIDEMDSPKKKDNTLISKIYQQHNVREYALAKRPHFHLQNDFRKPERSFSSDDEVFHKSPVVVSQKDIPEVRTQLETVVIKEEAYKNGNDDENDPGVEEIAKRKIVHNLLGKFSGSQTNLRKSGSREDVNGEDITYSVKDLRKKFEIKQAKSNVVSSLTARSLSKQMKQNLRH